jgi:hypothetical protein
MLFLLPFGIAYKEDLGRFETIQNELEICYGLYSKGKASPPTNWPELLSVDDRIDDIKKVFGPIYLVTKDYGSSSNREILFIRLFRDQTGGTLGFVPNQGKKSVFLDWSKDRSYYSGPEKLQARIAAKKDLDSPFMEGVYSLVHELSHYVDDFVVDYNYFQIPNQPRSDLLILLTKSFFTPPKTWFESRNVAVAGSTPFGFVGYGCNRDDLLKYKLMFPWGTAGYSTVLDWPTLLPRNADSYATFAMSIYAANIVI